VALQRGASRHHQPAEVRGADAGHHAGETAMKMSAVIVLVFSAVTVFGQVKTCPPRIHRIATVVGPRERNTAGESTTDFHYCIYFGDEETSRLDEVSGRAGAQRNLLLLHPVVEVASRMLPQAPHRWYALLVAEAGVRRTGLLTESTWPMVPAPVRHVLAAFGVDDPELVSISYKTLSGSISVYFDPRHDRDLAYYGNKLDRLLEYLNAHDLQEDLPLQNIVRNEDDAAWSP
jgi:hypothetical protein